MSVTVYEPTGIVHSVIAHLGDTRAMTSVVHLTQYDDTLPIIAVKLMNGAQPYKIPESATVSIRVGKPDKTGVYNPCLGVSSDYTTAYFAATEQMCAADGKAFAVVEIIDGGTASTGIFVIDIAENPVNDETVLSDSELGIVQGLVDQAESARDDAGKSASNAEKSASNAQVSAGKALDSATLAGQHKDDAESAKNSAEQFANKAEQEATTAEQARDTAEEYMEKAQASSAVSNSSYYIGDDGMLHLSFNSEGLGKNDIDQTLDKLSADVTQLDTDMGTMQTMLDQQTMQISQTQGEVDDLQADMGTVLMRQVNLANCISAPAFTISGIELLRIDIPSSYRGKRAMFELVGMSIDVVTGMASIEARQIDGNNQTTPFLAIDAGQGTNKPISRIITVNIDADTTAINLVGMLGSTSASARITSGTNFYCKVTILAN